MAKYEIYIFIILILMILLRPGVLYDLNNTMSGKFVFVVVIVLVTRYKPYLGLVMFLLIICLNNIREGVMSKKEIAAYKKAFSCRGQGLKKMVYGSRYGIQPGFATAFTRCVVLRALLGKMLLACAAACAGRWAITGVFDVACGLSRYTRQPPCRRAVRNKH